MNQRPLFEPCELGRSPVSCVHLMACGRLGVNGFGGFPRNESHSAAGPTSGNIKTQGDTGIQERPDSFTNKH